MIAKKDLVVGAYYVGRCRNTYVAKWTDDNQFIYMRYKLGFYLIETIKHPEDDNGFDLFVPMRKVEELTDIEDSEARDIVRTLDEK